MSLMNSAVYSPSCVRNAPMSSAPDGTSRKASAQAKNGAMPTQTSGRRRPARGGRPDGVDAFCGCCQCLPRDRVPTVGDDLRRRVVLLRRRELDVRVEIRRRQRVEQVLRDDTRSERSWNRAGCE